MSGPTNGNGTNGANGANGKGGAKLPASGFKPQAGGPGAFGPGRRRGGPMGGGPMGHGMMMPVEKAQNFRGTQHAAMEGELKAYVRATGAGGPITLTATADGLAKGTVTFETAPARPAH